MKLTISKPYYDKKRASYSVIIYVDGKRYHVRAKTKNEAILRAMDRADDLRHEYICDGVTVAEFADIWLSDRCCSLSPTTLVEWRRLVEKEIKPVIGHRKLADLKTADVQKLITEYNGTHASKSCSALRGVLHAMFEYAVVNEIIIRNPADNVYISKTKPYEYYIYSAEEMFRLHELVKNTVYETPVILASLCGLRLSEICGLRWEDVDLARRVICIHQVVVNGGPTGCTPTVKETPKTATAGRPIFIPQKVVDYLSGIKPENATGFVFTKADGSVRSPRNFGKQFTKFLRLQKMPHTRFHDLRHFVATSLMDAGMPDKKIAAYLRHADTNVTKRYEHIRANARTESADIMDAIFS